MRIGDWSSDVCTSDLLQERGDEEADRQEEADQQGGDDEADEPQKLMLGGRLGRILADEFVVEARRVRSLGLPRHTIGRASCRERVCQYVWIAVVAVTFKKKKEQCRENVDRHKTHTKQVSYAEDKKGA